jgi:hypothetical protein
MHRPCFIIAHRYYQNYPSYILHYIENIQKFYENSIIILVDNNSKYLHDIKRQLNPDIIVLVNDTECKFEIGAYKVGINYILSNNLLNDFDYYVFTQDNFIIKNKYEFDILDKNNTFAAALDIFKVSNNDFYQNQIVMNVLKSINLEKKIDDLTLCWCNSFILNKTKIIDYLNIVKDIIIVNRSQSEASERYLSGILYYLNNHIMTSINNIGSSEKYDCWSVDLLNDSFPGIYFVKKVQQKNERTIDHEIIDKRIIDKRTVDKRTSHKSFFSRNTFSSIIFHKK